MLEFLPIVVVVVLVILAVVHSSKLSHDEYKNMIEKMKKEGPAQKTCPPHPWTYRIIDGVEKIWCPKCSMVPGDETYTPRGN